MARKGKSPSPVRVRSWKSIQQKVPNSVRSARSRRGRDLLIWVGAICFSVGLIFLSYLLLFEPERILGSGPEFRIELVAYETDGTLDKDWLLERLGLMEGASLLQTDIFGLREKIASHPQVKGCVVRRKYPETLQVMVQEYKPVLRLRMKVDGNSTNIATVFVARDGSVFPGIGRDASETRRMPFLSGVELVEMPMGYAPIPGFRKVADLVDLAQSSFPDVFSSWRIIDLSLYDPNPSASFSAIRVRATNVGEILFGTEDLSGQLLRLKDIVTLTRERGIEKLPRVDLRFDESVPVVTSESSQG